MEEIHRVLVEVAIAKLCSFYEIGPEFVTDVGFDAICYSDCIDFLMEVCEPVDHITILDSQTELQRNLRMMHHLGLVHKDIKP